jgi:hypothetical protein|tara:strand:+ start:3338 stop:3538 length:201 start_codon:yes stop_codon:yes gene_type:complete
MDYVKVVEYLLEKYRERCTALEETLASGGVASFEQYQRVVGEISGLRSAEQEIIDLRKNMEKEVDD